VWGARLSYNFARKDGYTLKGEDYRWPWLRARVHWIAFQLLNLVFIAPWQNLLLLWIATPVYVCSRLATPASAVLRIVTVSPSAAYATSIDMMAPALGAFFTAPSLASAANAASVVWNGVVAAVSALTVGGSLRVRHVASAWSTLNVFEWALIAAFVVLLLIETVADQQQWRFQNLKYSIPREKWATHANAEVRDGFCHSGLFRWSRHPNFVCEMSLWWVLAAFAGAASRFENHAATFNWTLGGTFFLTLLFQGSTPLTELITSEKYPAYRLYQRTTSRLLFWLPSSATVSYADQLKAESQVRCGQRERERGEAINVCSSSVKDYRIHSFSPLTHDQMICRGYLRFVPVFSESCWRIVFSTPYCFRLLFDSI
jgi:steroid 5-alpha reductase family enzyme